MREVRRNWSRRRLLQVGVATTAASALAACGATPTPQVIEKEVVVTQVVEKEVTKIVEGTPQVVVETVVVESTVLVEKEVTPAPAQVEKVEIEQLFSNWGEEWNNYLMKFSTQYTEEVNPNVQVKWNWVDGDYTEKFLTLVAAGTLPDISYSNLWNFGYFASKGALTAVDEYMAAAELTREKCVAGYWDNSFYEGSMYSLPTTASGRAWFWSKDLYSEVGLDPEKPPRDLKELEEHSDAILQSDADGKITRMGYAPGNIERWIFYFGGELYDPDTKKITADHPGCVEAGEWMASWAAKYDMSKMDAFWSGQPGYSAADNPFAKKIASYLPYMGFWAQPGLDDYAADLNYGISRIPMPNGSEDEFLRSNDDNWMMVIPKDAKHPAEAFDFWNWYWHDNYAAMSVEAGAGISPWVDQLGLFHASLIKFVGDDNRMVPYIPVFIDAVMHVRKFWPVIPSSWMLAQELWRAQDFILRNGTPPQEALAEVSRVVQEDLDKQFQS